MKQYYLAHQLTHRKKVLEIQKEIEYYYGLTLINPFYDTQRNDIEAIDKGLQSRYNIDIDRCREIVLSDLQIIRDCDGIICIVFDHEAIGTFMELFYAWCVCDIPVYLVCYDEKIRNHPWINTVCYKIFSNIEELKDYIKVNKKDMR